MSSEKSDTDEISLSSLSEFDENLNDTTNKDLIKQLLKRKLKKAIAKKLNKKDVKGKERAIEKEELPVIVIHNEPKLQSSVCTPHSEVAVLTENPLIQRREFGALVLMKTIIRQSPRLKQQDNNDKSIKTSLLDVAVDPICYNLNEDNDQSEIGNDSFNSGNNDDRTYQMHSDNQDYSNDVLGST